MPVNKVRDSIVLLVTNGLDGVQFRGLNGRIDSKQQSDEYRYAEGNGNRRTGYHRRPARGRRNDLRQREPEGDADETAGNRDQDRLGQELAHDVALAGANGAADADFARPLEHRRQHDVHDADAAHQQRNTGDADHDNAEDELGSPPLLEQPGGHHHGEIARVLMGGFENGAHHAGGLDEIDA